MPDGCRRKIVGALIVAAVVAVLVVAYLLVIMDGPETLPSDPAPGEDPASPEPDVIDPGPLTPRVEAEDLEPDRTRWLYPDQVITRYRVAMSGEGPYYAAGDAGHGGPYSPDDGMRAETIAAEFLADPSASYWNQPNLPYEAGDPRPDSGGHVRPMFAAWVFMTQPDHPERDRLERELKKLLLVHANDPTLDYSNSDSYPANFSGAAANPIFETAQWFVRLVKSRDMLGREAFTTAENATLDRWFYGYANWSAHWLHDTVYGEAIPGRLDRDYSVVPSAWSQGDAQSYDGGPAIANGALAYSNRHASVASAMSIAANYLEHYGYSGATSSPPSYGVYDVAELLEHSRLFVEETLRFSVYPEGFQGDFERGDEGRHPSSSPQQGWLYSVNVLANLMEIAEYHAAREDMSVWEYGTTDGLAGSGGPPVDGGFTEKNLHFFAWSLSRYARGGWGRTNRGEPLVEDDFYHDVIPAAMAHGFARDDSLLEAAWKRDGEGFPAYPESPQSQGPYHAYHGEGSKTVGLIEQAGSASDER